MVLWKSLVLVTEDNPWVFFHKYPSIKASYDILSSLGDARMSGTGGTTFVSFDTFESAKAAISIIPKNQKAVLVSSL